MSLRSSLPCRCGWHEERGIKFCALATAKIYCYIVSESLCPLFSVALTSAHLPKVTTSDTVDIVVGRSSRKGRGFGRGGRGPGPWTPARSTTPRKLCNYVNLRVKDRDHCDVFLACFPCTFLPPS